MRSRNPQMLFVSETKFGDDITNKVNVSCKFEGCLILKREGEREAFACSERIRSMLS